jgi:hypothetical protein
MSEAVNAAPNVFSVKRLYACAAALSLCKMRFLRAYCRINFHFPKNSCIFPCVKIKSALRYMGVLSFLSAWGYPLPAVCDIRKIVPALPAAGQLSKIEKIMQGCSAFGSFRHGSEIKTAPPPVLSADRE